MKNRLSALALFFFFSILSAQGSQTGSVIGGLAELVAQIQEFLPIISMLLVMCAGVVYAAGSIAGAETRAKASTWATVMVMGAVIGILIVIILPRVFCLMYGPDKWNVQGAVLAGSSVCG